jgi:dTDP-4-amino-4,6-dideoxygalactose transaminase
MPYLDNREEIACKNVIASNQLSQNKEVSLLEKELSTYVGHKYGIAVSSGTAAIYLALKALGIGPKDSVIIPSYVCTALLNAVIFAGAQPCLCDVCSETGNMNLELVKKVVKKNTKAIIVPHMFGYPADAKNIEKSLGIPVIEDCAQCVGTSIGNNKIGSLTELSVFSFYATKLICAGEGGMVATSNKMLSQKIHDLREYDNKDRYIPRFNFKLSDIHAALARIQLKKLNINIKKRKEIAKKYFAELSNICELISLPFFDNINSHIFYRFVIRVDANILGIITKMEKMGIACRKPVHKPLHNYLKKEGFKGTEKIYKTAISIPIYPSLTKKQVTYIADSLINVLNKINIKRNKNVY